MSIEEVSERLNRLAEAIAERIPALTQEAAITAKTKIQERIQESGLNEELVSFPAYNPKYKKRKEEGKVKGRGAGAVNFRDLTLSGAMWRQTGIKSQGDNGGRYEVVVGGLNQEAQDKINWNSEQLGDILKISDAEEQILKEDYEAGLDELIAQSGLK